MLISDGMRKEITLRSYLFGGATTEAPNEDGEIECLPASSNTSLAWRLPFAKASFHDYRFLK